MSFKEFKVIRRKVVHLEERLKPFYEVVNHSSLTIDGKDWIFEAEVIIKKLGLEHEMSFIGRFPSNSWYGDDLHRNSCYGQ